MPHLDLRKAAIAATIGVGAALVALALGLTTFVQTLELKLYDQRLAVTADGTAARRDLVLVAIDEYSVRQMEPFVGRWPWPRFVHGQVIDLLREAGAKVIVYDVLFTERDRRTGFLVGDETWTGEESDKAFADAVRQAGNVVFAAEATTEAADATPLPDAPWTQVVPDPTFEPRPSLTLPYPELASAARALGHNLLVVDADGPVRRSIPFIRVGTSAVPSLPMAAVMVAGTIAPRDVRLAGDTLHLGAFAMPMLRERVPVFAESGDVSPWTQRALIPYRGPAVAPDGKTTLYEELSFVKLLAVRQLQLDGEDPGIDLSRFRGATVVIGLTAAGLHDVYQSPFGSTGKMSGPMIQASVIDQIVSQRAIRPWPRWASVLLVALAGVLSATIVLASPHLRVSLPTLGALAFAGTWGAFRAFAAGHWVPLTEPGLALVAATFSGVAWQYFVEGREKRAVKRLFSRYLSKDVYEQLLKNPALAELGGNRREMTVLFSDIRGFTAMTESGQPEAIVAMLNQYFSRMVDLVFRHRGTLDKFVGDMVMALYGAPLDDPDHADHAVQTALAMVAELERLNEQWAREGRPRMDIGIGINSGEMIAGNIGAETIRSYTVIGDNVNLGSRLESLNKDYGTRIIISQFTVDRLKQRYDLESLGAVRVKGKSKSVDIYEVRGLAAPPEAG